MRCKFYFITLALCLSLSALLPFASQVTATTAPLCDVNCRPNPGSSTYGGTFAARPLFQNVRGDLSVFSQVAFGSSRASRTVIGSQSYSYAMPILNLPGRNGLDVNLTLFYNSAVWTIDLTNRRATFNSSQDFPNYGFRLNYGTIEGPQNDSHGVQSYLLTEPDGTVRDLQFVTATDYQSIDSSLVDFNPSTLVLKRKNGAQWTYVKVGTSTVFIPVKIEDTNGNYITITYDTDTKVGNQAIATITDTLGRQITFNYDTSGRLTSITAPAYGGGTYTAATFVWGTVALTYNYSLTVVDTQSSGSSINVLTGLRYPSGTGYNFTYGGWGIIDQIQHVSNSGMVRGYVSYNYPSGSTSLSGAPTYTQQTVFDGVNVGIWTYQTTLSGGLVSSMKITDPAGTITTTYLFASGLVNYFTVGNATTTLRQVGYQWLVSGYANPLVSSVMSTLNDSLQRTWTIYQYTLYGNVSQVLVYDYGSYWSDGPGVYGGGGGPLLSKTVNTFQTGSAYVSQHILDRATEVQAYNSMGTLISRTDYGYDGGSLQAQTGASQHDDTNYGTSFATRGNLTSVTNYPTPSNPATAITRALSYDMLGNLVTAAVDCCNQESWTFAADNQYAYPEVLTRGAGSPQFTTHWAYDFNTGLTNSQTDENGKVSSFHYDSMNRLTSVIRPDQVTISTQYDDSASQPSTQTTVPIDAGVNEIQTTTTDGLGRLISQSASGGSLTSIVATQYDTLGRVSQASNPYASGGSPVWTTYTYDALSRPLTVTPPGSTGAYQYSYSGNSTTATDPAAKQRRSFTDALGRLTQVYEPGYGDGTPATGSVTISGADQHILVPNPNPPPANLPFYDSGTVTVTVGSYSAYYNYALNGAPDSTSSIATGLAYTFNHDPNSPVTAAVNSATLNLTSKIPGPQGNYALSISTTYDTTDFSSPSFSGTTSGGTMTGGVDGNPNNNPPSLTTPLVTVYNYDPLGELTSVLQGQQVRSYVYDGMGRLTSARTPEAGTVGYSYTTSSHLSSRTDARNVVTSYSYDGLNRLAGISYNVVGTGVPATSSVSFTYDQGGSSANANDRLTTMTDGTGSETYQYDLLGRETGLTKVVGGVSYPLTYQYNYAGELKQVQYPSGRAVSQAFDALARLSQVSSGTTNYLSNAIYNAASEPTGFQYGNGVQAAFTYNAQMQLQTLAYTKSGSAIFSLTYNYGTGDNGQIQGITDNVDNGRTAAYTYDAWSRLKTAQTPGSTNYPQWGLSWGYDRYGNRLNQTTTAGSPYQGSFPVDPTTNHITGSPYAYDLSGNMTNDGLNTLVYDAENRVTSSGGTLGSGGYAYDGNSLRVSKTVSGTTTVYIFSGSKVIAEYASGAAPASPSKEYIHAGSQLLATISGGTINYHVPDHLSARVTTDSNGSVIGQQGNYPFGEYSWYASSTTTKWQFTSYERDAESSNDYAMARFNVAHLGRFSSPDPLAGSIGNPQSLNRYTYARNDAINFVDPSGAKPAPLQDDGWLFGGGGGSCTVDYMSVDCGMAFALLRGGLAAQCPNNICEGFSNGRWVQYQAFAGGGGGYYTMSGAGALYYSLEQAAIGFANYYESLSIGQAAEYLATFYEDVQDGVFSFAITSVSQCQPLVGPYLSCSGPVDLNAVPPGTTAVATGHTHPLQDEINDSEVLSGDDMHTSYRIWVDTGGDVKMLFIASVSGRVISYDPSWYTVGPGPSYACQTAGASVIKGPQSPTPYPPCPH
jgi:RHS repeat-associated protein